VSILSGIVPIIPTPFTADDRVAVDELERLVDFAIQSEVAAVGTPAFGSEFYKLDGVERMQVIEAVLARARGRIPVAVQCNHTSPRVAARLAQDAEKLGAAAVNVALPRAFASSPRQLEDFACAVCESVTVPVIIQDWNPSGSSVGAEFAERVADRCSNFRYLKLEEPGIGARIREIRSATGGRVEVFLGWGGLYMLELQAAGACGVMPGLGVADILVQIWRLAVAGQRAEALRRFGSVAPYLQFSLQTFEQFHHAEKQLLKARGVLASARVRAVTVELDADSQAYLGLLLEHVQAICAAGAEKSR
jgi:2-keto-3-deoxy-L-arabinonate dehydratase